jgi:hypothetical protein
VRAVARKVGGKNPPTCAINVLYDVLARDRFVKVLLQDPIFVYIEEITDQ